ncbi:MAG: SMC family ATPase, partial [Oscillibacter sp.]|nr:SMC family ATPase [Oscillibacter sp.]
SHPAPAQPSAHAPSEEALKKAKESAALAQTAAAGASARAGELKGAAEARRNSLALRLQELSCTVEDLPERTQEAQDTIRRLSAAIAENRQKTDRKAFLDASIPAHAQRAQEAQQALQGLSSAIAQGEARVQELEGQRASLTLRFSEKKAAEAAIRERTAELGAMKDALSKAEAVYREAKEALTVLEANIAQLKELTRSDDLPDGEQERKRREALTAQKADLSRTVSHLYARISGNRSLLRELSVKVKDITELETKWMWVKALSNTANGSIAGKEKVMLETYVQTTYFDRIIRRANTRFMVMSGGQYELQRRKEAGNNRSQSGLELDVIDHYNGTVRSVRTLSGGESFKASLSLALGLSDEVQSCAGGIRLDTMFVDEGFGSLDEESLQQAIAALAGLTEGERLVGIISHVGELKERIDRQIVVKKDRSGGSRVTIRT